MPVNIAGTNAYPTTIVGPAPGDQRTAASVVTGLSGLADRTAALRNGSQGYTESVDPSSASPVQNITRVNTYIDDFGFNETLICRLDNPETHTVRNIYNQTMRSGATLIVQDAGGVERYRYVAGKTEYGNWWSFQRSGFGWGWSPLHAPRSAPTTHLYLTNGGSTFIYEPPYTSLHVWKPETGDTGRLWITMPAGQYADEVREITCNRLGSRHEDSFRIANPDLSEVIHRRSDERELQGLRAVVRYTGLSWKLVSFSIDPASPYNYHVATAPESVLKRGINRLSYTISGGVETMLPQDGRYIGEQIRLSVDIMAAGSLVEVKYGTTVVGRIEAGPNGATYKGMTFTWIGNVHPYWVVTG